MYIGRGCLYGPRGLFYGPTVLNEALPTNVIVGPSLVLSKGPR